MLDCCRILQKWSNVNDLEFCSTLDLHYWKGIVNLNDSWVVMLSTSLQTCLVNKKKELSSMAKRKRLSTTPTTMRKSKCTRKQTQKCEICQDDGAAWWFVYRGVNHVNETHIGSRWIWREHHLYDLVTDFDLDVNGSNIGCYNTLIYITEKVEKRRLDWSNCTQSCVR